MLALLSHVHAKLGRLPNPPLVLRALRRLGRIWLREVVLQQERSRPADITVVIGVRNRSDYRLVNALRSIRAQEYSAGVVRIIVVEYGSKPENARITRDICEQHRADYVAVEQTRVWSRSRCLNVGIRLVETKFLMTSDVDVVLSPRYLADAVQVLEASPLSVVCSHMFDLPEESEESLARAAATARLPIDDWKALAKPRYDWIHPSVAVSHARLYQLIRGYDEYYEVWGLEDDDLMRRLVYLGLSPKGLDSGSFYLHQWHPKFNGLPGGREAEPVRRNESYFRNRHSIVRNDRDWGRA
jgi:hypothetical protein